MEGATFSGKLCAKAIAGEWGQTWFDREREDGGGERGSEVGHGKGGGPHRGAGPGPARARQLLAILLHLLFIFARLPPAFSACRGLEHVQCAAQPARQGARHGISGTRACKPPQRRLAARAPMMPPTLLCAPLPAAVFQESSEQTHTPRFFSKAIQSPYFMNNRRARLPPPYPPWGQACLPHGLWQPLADPAGPPSVCALGGGANPAHYPLCNTATALPNKPTQASEGWGGAGSH